MKQSTLSLARFHFERIGQASSLFLASSRMTPIHVLRPIFRSKVFSGAYYRTPPICEPENIHVLRSRRFIFWFRVRVALCSRTVMKALCYR